MLSAVLLMGMLPFTAFAATEEEVEELKERAKESHRMSLASTGKNSLGGFCGMMTSHQLYHMGINKSLLTFDGNGQYDAYKDMLKTTGGYYIRSYDVKDYSLEAALNDVTRNGTRDVYNLIACFQWTKTEAGQMFGHSCYISGILDGVVYFMEGFYTPFGGPEGNVSICTIKEFAEYFKKWTIYEGLIYFGTGQYADACKQYSTDIFVRTRFKMPLRSQPYVVGLEGSQVLRTVAAGERLRVTGILENTEGELYYRVQDGYQTGYIVAETAILDRTNGEDLRLTELQFPDRIDTGSDGDFVGTVQAENGLVGSVELVITDANGKQVLRSQKIADAVSVDLSELNALTYMNDLKKGVYTATLYAQTASAYVSEGALDYSYARTELHRQRLVVGDATGDVQDTLAPRVLELSQGWYWQEGTWYYYQSGKPVAGWLRERGVRYYLKEDGSITTGWAVIDGVQCYFSTTGALCIGWVTHSDGVRYSVDDGSFVTGWQTIDGRRYYFGEEGLMKTAGTMEDAGVKYEFRPDGQAIPTAAK